MNIISVMKLVLKKWISWNLQLSMYNFNLHNKVGLLHITHCLPGVCKMAMNVAKRGKPQLSHVYTKRKKHNIKILLNLNVFSLIT